MTTAPPTRALSSWVLFTAALCLGLMSVGAEAQTSARRRVPAGQVTGLDMAIDGSLEAMPGGQLRWYVTLFEVVRHRDLRPAVGATLTATASFAPAEAVATAVTDALGQAVLEVAIPDDVGGSVELRVEATSPRDVSRVFSVSLSAVPRYDLLLLTDRAHAAPGGRALAFGRLLDRVTGLPVPHAAVTTEVVGQGGGHRALRPAEVTTDENGVFVTQVDLASARGVFELRATARIGAGSPPPRSASASTRLEVQEVSIGGLWASVTTARRSVARGDRVRVDVRAFAPDGRPLVGARVRPSGSGPHREDDARTDARGEASMSVRVPRRIDGARWSARFEVVDPAHGSTEVVLEVPVARGPVVAAASVEGGALVPELEGRVFVRVVTPDGAPVRGRSVLLEAPRFGGSLPGTTDADGVAAFTARVATESGADACGGATAAAATLVVGEHREALCLPVDLDGALTLRSPVMAPAGGAISVTVARRPGIARRAVEVTALVQRSNRWVPVGRAVLGPREGQAAVDVPADVEGEVWLRGRPILDGGVSGRGGGALVYRGAPTRALEVSADAAGARVVDAAPDATSVLFTVDARSRGAAAAALGSSRGPLGAALLTGSGPALLTALAGDHTPRDEAASVLLRRGEVMTQSMPPAPVDHGLLRDPWRTRARFIRGRVGRLMRGVEHYVAAQEPDAMRDVVARRGGRNHFNASILEATANTEGIGEEGLAGLGGEPLDIASLTALDPAFTYDNVARRVTRERLFRLLVLLREHVHERGLDRPWARRGDPAEYLTTMLDGEGSFSDEWPEPRTLYDAWGRPFVLQPARGAPRFSFLEPVSGWELVSVGPDGRSGTADDLVDPFARVLPSGGLYSEAVGEDVLLARVRGVALGRATVASLAEVFDVPVPDPGLEERVALPGARGELPTPMVAGPARPPAPHLADVYGGLGPHQAHTLPEAHRAYEAVAFAFRSDGVIDVGRASFAAGAPFTAEVSWPVALRPRERIALPIRLRQHADGAEPTVAVHGTRDIVSATARDGEVHLEAHRPGMAEVVLQATMSDGVVVSRTHRLRVVPDGDLRARHTAAVAAPDARLALTVPEGATPWRAELVLGAPQAMAADPLVAAALERHPAVAAWALSLAQGPIPPAVEADLDQSAGPAGEGLPSDIDRACALVAWAFRGGPAGAAHPGPRFQRLSASFGGSMSRDLRVRAAVLAALATAAPRVPTGGVYDPISLLINTLREDGWRTLSTSSEPAVMARMAAALLLIDSRDGPGRELLRRARRGLVADAEGHRSIPGDAQRPGDGFVGTLALALAARQVGDDALADELRTSALRGLHQAPRLGVEGAFWPAAASMLGAFGVGAPGALGLTIDGASRAVSLGDDGVTRVDVPPGAAIEVQSDRPVWVRAETRYLVSPVARDGGPVRAHIEGAPGTAGGRAGFEVVVKNEAGRRVGRPVVEVVIPGAARFDETAAQRVAAAPGVRRVSGPDGAGVVRIVLGPMRAGGRRRIALPLWWSGHGRTMGLSVASYDAAAPARISTRPSRVLQIEAEEP